MNQNKSFRQPFSKGCGFQRQSLWSHVATCETPLRWKRLLKGKAARQIVLRLGELFVREKVPSKLPIRTTQKNLPVGGFSGRLSLHPNHVSVACKALLSTSRHQVKSPAENSAAPFPRSAAGDSAAPLLPPGNSAAPSPPSACRGGTAQRIPPHPIYPFKHQKGAACQPAGCSFSVVSNYDFSGWKADSAPSRSPASAGPQR